MAAFIETDLRKFVDDDDDDDFLLRIILALGPVPNDVCLCFIPAAARMSVSISASFAELRSTRSASGIGKTFMNV